MDWLETHKHFETYKGKDIASVRRYRWEGKSPYKQKVVYDPEDTVRYCYLSSNAGWMGYVYRDTVSEIYSAIAKERSDDRV
jgi:hypothetical protein